MKKKTQITGVSVKGNTVSVRPTVSSDSAEAADFQITEPKYTNIGSPPEPLDTQIVTDIFAALDLPHRPRALRFNHNLAMNDWMLGIGLTWYGSDWYFSIYLGPLVVGLAHD